MNLKLIMAVVLKTLGISALEKNATGQMSVSADQEKQLRTSFGNDFTEKFLKALKEENAANTTSTPAQEQATSDDLRDALRAHFSQEAANELRTIKEQLAAINKDKETLQTMVNALASEPEENPHAESANVRAGNPKVPTVLKVNMAHKHYTGVNEMFNTGSMISAAEATIEVSELKQEFGTYLSQGGTNLDIIRQILTGFTSARYFTTKAAVTEWRAVQALITSVSQQFTNKWTPLGKAKFTPITIYNRRHKINYPIIPSEVIDSYMLHLYDEGLAPNQMPITKYIWDTLVYPALLQDIELRMIWKGKYVPVDPSTVVTNGPATPPEDSMDGLETILVDAKTTGDKGINFYNGVPGFDWKTATAQQVLQHVNGFADWLSPMYKGMSMPIFLSDENKRIYQRAYKEFWGQNSGQSGDFGDLKVDYTNNIITAPDGMYASPIMFSTPQINMIKLRHKNSVPQVINDVQVQDYEVKLFGEYWLGVGFAIGEAVFAYVPAGYNPKTQITESWGAFDDYQSWKYGSDAGSDAGGV